METIHQVNVVVEFSDNHHVWRQWFKEAEPGNESCTYCSALSGLVLICWHFQKNTSLNSQICMVKKGLTSFKNQQWAGFYWRYEWLKYETCHVALHLNRVETISLYVFYKITQMHLSIVLQPKIAYQLKRYLLRACIPIWRPVLYTTVQVVQSFYEYK